MQQIIKMKHSFTNQICTLCLVNLIKHELLKHIFHCLFI